MLSKSVLITPRATIIEITISQIREFEKPLKASFIPVLDFKFDIAVFTFSSYALLI
ncbi:hypothetical protein HMH39_001754 [Campylobacter jejuni]|nr:hypothetical protein [Campylobacter jejuni]EGI2893173.1 hypothetical protein [Campylobacter jejuni]EGK7303911.1 hypothetical protein [Campylobacter jejuni]